MTTTVRGAGAVASDTCGSSGRSGGSAAGDGSRTAGAGWALPGPARRRRTDRTVRGPRGARCAQVTPFPHTLWGPDKRRLDG
ncbi:Uncharacterised protein [Mycobacteroides abscessus]|nr:Uncharacterised protein [Mycobacteroides abscessus]